MMITRNSFRLLVSCLLLTIFTVTTQGMLQTMYPVSDLIKSSVSIRPSSPADEVMAVHILPDGKRCLALINNKKFEFWDILSGMLQSTLPADNATQFQFCSVAQLEDVIAYTAVKTRNFWNPFSGREGEVGFDNDSTTEYWGRFMGSGCEAKFQPVGLANDPSEVTAFALSADGAFVAAAIMPVTKRGWKKIHVINCRENRHIHTFKHDHSARITTLLFSADKDIIFSASHDRTIKLWNITLQKQCLTLEHAQGVESMALADDKNMIAAGLLTGEIILWDYKTGNRIRELSGHTGVVHSVVLSVDGSILVSGGKDRTIRVWDTASGSCLGILEGHADGVSSVALSADKKIIVSGSLDGTVRIWQLTHLF